jgi:23S rRNA pseudouridine2605 synthase
MLTRAPEERRGGNRGPVDPTRREQPARPPRAPRFDGRGPRPSGDRPAGDRSPGGRPPRGDRPPMGDRPPSGERPRFGGRPRDPAGGGEVRAQAPVPGNQATHALGPGGPPRPRRNGGDDQRRGQGWSGPVRRRGGWDEPMVVEASPAADIVPPPPQTEPAPAVESAEGEKK